MKKFLPFVLIFILSLPAARFLFGQGYFSMHDDLQVMRIFELEKCLVDGQIPCRWAPDMGWGYGQPMFNFYSAPPYYLGALVRILTPLSIIDTVKFLFLISLIGGAFGMYLLARQFFGNLGGLLSAIFYTYAPYHALDIFVRGALSESFALAILPFLWLFLYLLIKKPSFARISATAISIGALLTTHNVSTLIYAPFTILWIIFWVARLRDWKSIRSIAISGFWGLGLSAFFLLPVIFEQRLIQTEFLTMDYLNYEAHFVTIRQLFLDRSWGYGPSIFGPQDTLSFQIGWPHWWVSILLFFVAILWFRKKEKKGLAILLLLLLGAGGFSAFLTHLRSIPIWQALDPFIKFVQFPWRFLGLVIFFLSFAAGFLAKISLGLKQLFVVALIFLAILLNFGYFKSQYFFSTLTDEKKLSGVDFEIQQKSAILDYLPKTAPMAPKELAPENPKIVTGEGKTYNFAKRSNSFFFDAEIYQPATVQIPVMYFPGWKVISSQNVISSKPTGDYGVLTIELPKGKYIIQGRFENTPVRILGNTISVISASLIFIGAFLTVNNKKFLWLK